MAFSLQTFSSLASDPLFSTVITFCTLILLYFPTLFLGIVFSPILISTSLLLLSLLRLGAIQRSTREKEEHKTREENEPKTTAQLMDSLHQKSTREFIIDYRERVPSALSEERDDKDSKNTEFNSTQQSTHDLIIDDHKWFSSDFSESFEYETVPAIVPSRKSFHSDSFVEWNVRAPLEVIYEDYEGEDEEDDQNEGTSSERKREVHMNIIERYPSLSKFYPESDSDISSEEDFLAIRDWDSPEHHCFHWEGEEKEGLIEIELGRKRYTTEVEEENLIEIDLYPTGSPANGGDD